MLNNSRSTHGCVARWLLGLAAVVCWPPDATPFLRRHENVSALSTLRYQKSPQSAEYSGQKLGFPTSYNLKISLYTVTAQSINNTCGQVVESTRIEVRNTTRHNALAIPMTGG